MSRLYKNNRDGTFTDVTLKAGLARTGWGSGCCVGDFNNDGLDDLFVSYWGDYSLWKNLGNGRFEDVAAKVGVTTRTPNGRKRHNTGCAFVDYDKYGLLDLFVANYIEFDPKTAPLPESGPCKYKRGARGLWSPWPSRREEHTVSQQRRWDVFRRVNTGRD